MKQQLCIYRVFLPLQTENGLDDVIAITILAASAAKADESAKAMGGFMVDCIGGYNKEKY